jgi:hypothetical protein
LLSVSKISHEAWIGATGTVTKVSCLWRRCGAQYIRFLHVISQRLDKEQKFCSVHRNNIGLREPTIFAGVKRKFTLEGAGRQQPHVFAHKALN